MSEATVEKPKEEIKFVPLPEQIVGVAIRCSDKIYAMPGQPHSTLVSAIFSLKLSQNVNQAEIERMVLDGEEGFITTKGIFLDRSEAASFALRNKQVRKLQWGNKLFAEDLW